MTPGEGLIILPAHFAGVQFGTVPAADPGFPVGGVDLVGGGRGLPRQLYFANFVCQNERI